mgnify:FL=1
MKRYRILILCIALCVGHINCRKLSFDDESQGRAGDIVPRQQSREKSPNSDNIEEGYGRKFDSSAPPACTHRGPGDVPHIKPAVNTEAGGAKK